MNFTLSEIEARIMGCLIEKESVTPDNYPLSLNALTNACNQKSSREPVMDLDELTVEETLYYLRQKGLISQCTFSGGRVQKYQHRILDKYDFSENEIAVICLLLLRGAQTPGEIRTRSSRMFEFSSPDEVENVLESLNLRDDGPFVVKLPRQTGKREARYAHLFCGEIDIENQEESNTPTSVPPQIERLNALESKVGELEGEIQELKSLFQDFVKQFD